jgi:red chlorophyll catabolite reductase
LNIATLIAMLNAEADSPHLLFEFIQSGPSNLVLVLDLLPRKDLVLEPEYLQRFYESTGLENIKQEFEKSPQAQPYLSTALYIRSVVSPTALLYKLSGEGAEGGLDAVITQLVHPAAKNVFNTWLNAFRHLGHKLNDNEKLHVMKRDKQIKTKGVEVDLSGNMPQLFGQEVTDRVLKAFQKGE